MSPEISIAFFRVVDGEEVITFLARITHLTSKPGSCVISIIDTAETTGERSFTTYGGDQFHALYLGMRTVLRILRRHFESLPDELFGIQENDLSEGKGHTSAKMLEWLSEAYSGWEKAP